MIHAASSRAAIVRRHDRPGQGLVELAIILPLLSLILLGVVDLGRAFFYYERLTNAVEQGGLYASQYPTQITNITVAVTQESANSSGVSDPNLANVTVTCYVGRSSTLRGGTGDCTAVSAGIPLVQSGDTVVVRATYTFRPITGMIVGVLGTGYQMSKSVKMVVL